LDSTGDELDASATDFPMRFPHFYAGPLAACLYRIGLKLGIHITGSHKVLNPEGVSISANMVAAVEAHNVSSFSLRAVWFSLISRT